MNLKLQLDLDKEYGLVLEGGGAKGAYQIGVWKALEECGVRLKGVSGVSVGALNGAMICMDDLDNAIEIWENISYSQVMDVDDAQLESLLRGDFKSINLNDMVQEGLRIIREKGIDVTPLKNLIAKFCNEEVIRNSPLEFYVMTYSISDRQGLDVDVKELPDGLMADMMLASAYLPTFKRERLHGKHYLDGGVFDRVPLEALISRGYENIIVARIFGYGVEKKVKIPENVQVIDIAPVEDLGGVLEFDSSLSRKNIQLGYYDAMKVLYGLAGVKYYMDLDMTEEEACARLIPMAQKRLACKDQKAREELGRMMEELERMQARVQAMVQDKVPEKMSERLQEKIAELSTDKLQTKIQEMLAVVGTAEKKPGLRRIHEDLLPELAKKLLKNKNWTYRELYAQLLEQMAISLDLPRFVIYTEETLLQQIGEELETIRKENGQMPGQISGQIPGQKQGEKPEEMTGQIPREMPEYADYFE